MNYRQMNPTESKWAFTALSRFLTLIRFITFIALGVYFFTYLPRKTAALPTLLPPLNHISTRTLPCGHRCVIRWAFPFFCFVLIPIQLGFSPKTARKLIFNTFFFLFSHANLRSAMRLSHYDFIAEDGGGIRGGSRTSHHRLLCFYCFLHYIPTCARFVYIFSSSCFPFFSLFFCKLFCVYNKCIILWLPH